VSEAERLVAAMRPVLGAAPEGPVGIAVSGGGDSVALLVLARRWAGEAGREIAAVTIDHGLRPESAGEAAAVAALCAERGIAHEVRRWQGWDGGGNLQDRARTARRGLIAAWARERGIAAVALGHTLDDQAETFLMRLARGSGVDGLAAMRPSSEIDGLLWLRPLLQVRRQTLRDFLASEGVAWAEDPGNVDLRFDRVRARAALVPLAGLGLGPERLAATATRMARAREALEIATADLARAAAKPGAAGDVELDPARLRRAPLELRLRLLAGTLVWVCGSVYRPRLAMLEAALAAVETGRLGRGLTLHGCVLRPRGERIAVRREPGHAAPPVPLARGRWDGRWQIEEPHAELAGAEIGALGAIGLSYFPDWRGAAIPRETLLTTPAVWQGGRLVAAPLVRADPRFRFRRVSAVPPPWGRDDLALNPPPQGLC
jgi:tRNA(Ile)-lysidine synthase